MRVTYLAESAESYLYPPGTILSLRDMPPEIRWHLVCDNGFIDRGYINFYDAEGYLYDDIQSPNFKGMDFTIHKKIGNRSSWFGRSGIII